MALPAPVRPKCVIEELKLLEQNQEIKTEFSSDSESSDISSLTIESKKANAKGPRPTIDPNLPAPEAFMEAMKNWHNRLSIREKNNLTRLRVNRRAVLEASRLNLPIKQLPENWFKRLKNEVGLVVYIKRTTYIKRRKELKAKKKALEQGTATDQKPKSKFVDLTDAPPPAWWIQAYTEGRAPPRHQGTFLDGEKVTIYWDYNVKNWADFDPKTQTILETHMKTKAVMLPHDADGVMDQYQQSVEKCREHLTKIARSRGIYYDKLVLERHLESEKRKDEQQQNGSIKCETKGSNPDDFDSDFD